MIRVDIDDFPDPLREVPNHLFERTALLTNENLKDMLLVTQIIVGLVIRSEEPIGPIRKFAVDSFSNDIHTLVLSRQHQHDPHKEGGMPQHPSSYRPHPDNY